LEEARKHAHEYASVLTAGPDESEVRFNHPDHLVVTFDDVTDPTWQEYSAPTYEDVKKMISWAHGRENLLVHCHAGISRSTSTAWGVAISNGFDPEEAYVMLRNNHPKSSFQRTLYSRSFYPNELIVTHLEKLFHFNEGELVFIMEKNHRTNPWIPARTI
jgi:predicted protein tyrosine phosphatase